MTGIEKSGYVAHIALDGPAERDLAAYRRLGKEPQHGQPETVPTAPWSNSLRTAIAIDPAGWQLAPIADRFCARRVYNNSDLPNTAYGPWRYVADGAVVPESLTEKFVR